MGRECVRQNGKLPPISGPVSTEQTNPWRRQPPIFTFLLRLQRRTASVSSNHGCERIAPATHQDQAISDQLPSPWRLGRPRRTLVPLRVHMVHHIRVAAITLAPIRCWLTSLAIRFLQLGDGGTASNSFAWAEVPPGSLLGLPVTVLIMQSSVSRQMACAPSRCESTLAPACGLVISSQQRRLFSSSFAHKTVWPGHSFVAHELLLQ